MVQNKFEWHLLIVFAVIVDHLGLLRSIFSLVFLIHRKSYVQILSDQLKCEIEKKIIRDKKHVYISSTN